LFIDNGKPVQWEKLKGIRPKGNLRNLRQRSDKGMGWKSGAED